MKNSIFLFLFLISISTFAATNCNIGNESSTGYTNPADPIYKNYLLGIKFTLSNAGTLKSLNLLGRNSQSSVKMALYKSEADTVGALIAETAAGTVKSGIISLAVTPTFLDVGDYWIMAVYSADGSHTYSKTLNDNVIYYKTMTFTDGIPTTGKGFKKYTNTTFTYFLGIDCGNTTAITQANNSAVINFYPNPASDQVTINTQPSLIGETYRITNISGTELRTGVLTDETTVVDISELQAGFYFMLLGDRERETIKFVKQ
ncbi:T9SS type A sorting domain-containing protein [Cytophaga aurantiaca]|uniref:T9SS type A sorting domain-containing protein n=1 Tax=Cytophaga aurantiaca TaxID=29530 RepID=UPI0003744648|nr:T9SS type A sorting domain-containing protein [Cytophaga aurantiaca]